MARRAWRPGTYRWRVAPPREAAAGLARAAGTAPLVAQVLLNRGVSDADSAKAFLDPKLTDLHDPSLLPGAVEAARRIVRAIHDRERIVLYGDYDVDGMTGVAVLYECLRMLGAEPHWYVPHRLEEGYGVNADAVRKLAADGAKLLITVDCGISAVGPLKEAQAAGLDVIVTDHHLPGAELPPATAIVHPSLPGGGYPCEYLAGAGVAFKLAWQVAREACGEKRVDEPMRRFLLNATCLAGLGTVADVVPLSDENRVLAAHGLRGLEATEHPGLRALIDAAGLAGDRLDTYAVGFRLAPRLNASGRMGHARLALELLTRAEPDRCREIADYLNKQNTQRQKVEQEITAQAAEQVVSRGLDGDDHRAIVLGSDNWHGGVVGIVASRLVDRFAKPTVLVSLDGEELAHGSARSIPDFHMRDALAVCAEHLEGFGGHAMAGGIKLRPEKLDAFADAFGRYAGDTLTSEQLRPTLQIDVEAPLRALQYHAVEHLSRLAPFGEGNPRPVVAIRGCEVVNPPKRIGRNGNTASMIIAQNGATMRAVGFSMGDLADLLVGVNRVDIVAEPVINNFRGQTSVELKLRDVAWE
ncbi:MAG: single-stranded-DNA-specific exonuclease RecJ [Planctomycetota bacterium]